VNLCEIKYLMSMLRYATYPSCFGPLILGVSDIGLAMLLTGTAVPRYVSRHFDSFLEDMDATERYWQAVESYLRTGDIPELPLDLRGTNFQLRCWRALQQIPKGETRSYLDLAKQVATPTATRAVGGANGANPVAIIVPCHRAIASDGTLGGYGGGLAMKAALLDLEGARYKSSLPLRASQSEFQFRS
jgi:O-6-methylguanine DNA methyltransferase